MMFACLVAVDLRFRQLWLRKVFAVDAVNSAALFLQDQSYHKLLVRKGRGQSHTTVFRILIVKEIPMVADGWGRKQVKANNQI